MADDPAPEDIEKWNKWFAVECNNRAWRLAEQTSRTLGGALTHDEERAIFEASFRTVPAPL
jgi:hypothetical protein